MTVKTGKKHNQDSKPAVSPSLNNQFDNPAELNFAWKQEIFDLAACILVVIASDQTLARINKRGCEILGYEADEVIGCNWFDTFLPEKHRNKTREFFARLIAGDVTPNEYYENLIMTRTGEERQIRWHNMIIQNRGGNILGTISSGEDITGQRTMEAALRESERNAFVLLNATFDAVFLADVSSNRILAANEQFARRFSTTVEKVVGNSIEEFVSPKLYPERYARARQVIKTGKSLTFIDQRDNVWHEHHYYPVKDDQGQVIRLGIFSKDITARYQAEQMLKEREGELHRRTIELEEANTALKVVLKNIEAEKTQLAETINANLQDAVLPYIEMLKREQSGNWHMKCLDAMETGLKQILSPFLKEMTLQHESLTPAEIQVANLIRDGRSSKDIADLLHVGVGTINTHRNNIRRKLGLKHGKINLCTYLRTITL